MTRILLSRKNTLKKSYIIKGKAEGMSKNFEYKVTEFIEILKRTKIDNSFNPWAENSAEDIENAAEIRCKNLKKFLIEREKAEFVLVAEAPSCGARYTGIPMTSEEVFSMDMFKGYKKTSKRQSPIEEKTAKLLWKEIQKDNKRFVFWNSFAFNDDKTGKYKKPKIKEIEDKDNIKILKKFISLYPQSKLISVGRNAQIAIGMVYSEYIRHPSRCGEKIFCDKLKNFLLK